MDYTNINKLTEEEKVKLLKNFSELMTQCEISDNVYELKNRYENEGGMEKFCTDILSQYIKNSWEET